CKKAKSADNGITWEHRCPEAQAATLLPPCFFRSWITAGASWKPNTFKLAIADRKSGSGIDRGAIYQRGGAGLKLKVLGWKPASSDSWIIAEAGESPAFPVGCGYGKFLVRLRCKFVG